MKLHPPDEILTVSGFTAALRSVVQSQLGAVWLRGEVSNLRRQSSGHSYFSLKDDRSQMAAVLFRGNASEAAQRLRDGQQVIVYGEASVYEARGQVQIVVRHILEEGLGRLQAAFEALKSKLRDEGLFEPNRKQPLPAVPLRLAVVTSPTGAALRDFISILRRRDWPGEVLVVPARVQGAEAAGDLVAALAAVKRRAEDFDAVVMMRGGGSLEDLWPFNEEAVVRAVAACPLPLVSGVGHETDFTLTDFAADLRAETPSGAAEVLSSQVLRFLEQLGLLGRDLRDLTLGRLEARQRQLERLGNRLERHAPQMRVEAGSQRLDDLRHRLSLAFERHRTRHTERLLQARQRLHRTDLSAPIEREKEHLRQLRKDLRRVVSQHHRDKLQTAQHLAQQLLALSPEHTLQRGYALIRDEDGHLVADRSRLLEGMHLTTEFRDGPIESRITDIEPARKVKKKAPSPGKGS